MTFLLSGLPIFRLLHVRMPVLLVLAYGLIPSNGERGEGVAAAQGQVLEEKLKITYVGSRDGVAPITFENYCNALFIRGTINGREAVILLDNAADFTTVDDGFAKSVGLTPGEPTKKLDTGTATLEVKTIGDVTLDIPKHIAIFGSFVSRDLQPLARLINHRIDAILGGDVINAHALGVIHSSNKMYILPSGRIAPKGKSIVIPLSNGGEFSAIVNGVPIRLYVDYGFNGTITLSPEGWHRAIPPDRYTRSGRYTGGEGIVSGSKKAFGNTMNIGSVTLENLEVSRSSSRTRGVDGLLGVGILSRFDVVLDRQANKLVLISK